MAHFPAILSMSRLAGSSDTQKVCRMTKSRNRTGSRAWRKSSPYHPPAHAVAATIADCKDPEVHSAAKADESLTKRAIPKVEVLYVMMGCSETSVLSTRRRRGTKPPAVAAAAFEKTLRRLCSRLLRQRQDFEWSNSLQRCCGQPVCFLNGHLQQQHGMYSMEVVQQTRSHRTIPSQGRLLQASHHWHRSQRSVRHIFSEHFDVVCAQQGPWLRGGQEYSQRHLQYRYSLSDCKVHNHLLRLCKQTQPQAQTARTQRGPHRREG